MEHVKFVVQGQCTAVRNNLKDGHRTKRPSCKPLVDEPFLSARDSPRACDRSRLLLSSDITVADKEVMREANA